VEQVAEPDVRRWLEVVLTELMCVPAGELSLLSLLHGARTSGTLAAAIGIDGGAQERRYVGGLHQLAVGLADRLGDVVRTSSAVSRVSWNAEGALVDYAGGTLLARHVVLAIAPSQGESIDFEPVLPVRRMAAQRLMPLGSVIKANVVYDRPFWRDRGLSGFVLDLDGPVSFCVDNSPPDSELGGLVSFFAADAARSLSDATLGTAAADVRRQRWTEQAVRWFGDEAARFTHYTDHDWSADPWIGGGYSGVVRPGAWADAGPGLVAPVGVMHLAGSESSDRWTGYVEGALHAGRRAAAEILALR
jgi:monoamine oxidase